ncbi:DUF3352 domain-containing protein [Leptolyngbya sp. CCNP1308]|uniref:DUF3352 domain-containing protein n=1 Tax=Leptolyngbya sp. CCNP1308 TaxID=3110255 RepID=UPI002B2179E5|nr:DUF3352 domain-containing protein [Leptolyngbya sp. CCNP1308]MEA5447005.1 DUF3352 domain-containing protein [Leptolyngbya sp. CCNP1308]
MVLQSKLLQKKPPLLLTLGAALLFIGGGALTFWATSRRGQLAKTLPAGANAIPANALAVVALSSDEAQWRRLRQFGTETTQAQFDQLLVQWRDRLLAEQDLNFARDIQPWVGPEITLAVLPVETGPSDLPPSLPAPELALASNLVVVIPIADANRAQADLGDRLGKAEAVEDAPYRGVTLQQIDGEADTPLYAAVLDAETAVLSPQLTLLKRAIDTYKGGESLVNRPEVGKAFEQVTETQPLARFYVDVPALAQTVAAAADPPIAPDRLRAFQTPRGLVGAIALQSRGVALEGISWLEPGSQTFATGNNADQMPQRLPTGALIAVSGGDFQQFWEDFEAGEQLSALLPVQANDLALGLQTATGLSLQENLLPWMAGEFALGVLNPPPAAGEDNAPPLPNPALVLMVKTNDREAATATFEQLDAVMESRYRFAIETTELGGVPVTRWTSPFDSLVMAHGWLDGDIAFFTLGQGIAEQVAPAPNRSLGENALFQTTTGNAPRPNNGHFFINLEALTGVENNLLLPPLPQDGLLSSEAIEAIGVTATVLSDRQVRYDITAALKRGDRPGPLPGAGSEDSEPAPEASPEPAPEADSPEAAPE